MHRYSVGVAGGNGLIARFGDLVAYVGRNDEAAAHLLAAADAAARTPNPVAVLADQLGLVAFGVARAVPFGVVAPTADGVLVLIHGAVTADIETASDHRSLSGKDGTWVRVVARDPARKIGIGARRHPSRDAAPRTDLLAGVVPGGGFVLRPSDKGKAAEITSQQPPQAETPATVRIPSPADSTTTALPVASPSTPVETAAVTAAAGALATPDGAVYPLDRAYVIGRAPLADDAVRNATASPIVVPYDPHVSRVHAYLTVERDGVFVRDASTSAGTFIAPPRAETWTQIGTGPTRLAPGWSLRIGDWIATLNAPG